MSAYVEIRHRYGQSFECISSGEGGTRGQRDKLRGYTIRTVRIHRPLSLQRPQRMRSQLPKLLCSVTASRRQARYHPQAHETVLMSRSRSKTAPRFEASASARPTADDPALASSRTRTLLALRPGRCRETVESRSTLGSEEVVELDPHLFSTNIFCFSILMLIEPVRR
jgi:hypothetical protein